MDVLDRTSGTSADVLCVGLKIASVSFDINDLDRKSGVKVNKLRKKQEILKFMGEGLRSEENRRSKL